MMPGRNLIFFSLTLFLAIPSQGAEEVRREVRSRLLERINADRVAYGLRPVVLDLYASEIADTYCGRQVEDGTRGHFSTDGLPPYMRYSFAGIDGTVLENAAAWSARVSMPESVVPELALKSHAKMINEAAPDDGHRRAILDPHATHVGIGIAWGGGEVRLVEAFFRRYCEWDSKSQKLHTGDMKRYSARLLDPRSRVDFVTVHYEPFPFRLSRERANRIDSYALPAETVRLEPERPSSPLDAAIRRKPEMQTFRVSGNEISFDLEFTRGRGVYTVVVWVRLPGETRAVAATNLSVIVEEREQGIAAGF